MLQLQLYSIFVNSMIRNRDIGGKEYMDKKEKEEML